VRLVDSGDVPGAGLDPEAVERSARDLRADAGAVRDGGAEVAGAWAGLGVSYAAPEAGQLLRVMDPVRADTDRLADELERVSSALGTFAGELREIVTTCDRLRVEVREFRARVAAAPVGGSASDSGFGSGSGFGVDSGLGLDPALATQNAFLASRISSVTEELAEAERACAAAIRAIDGPPQGGGGFGGFMADPIGTVAEHLTWGESPQPETCAGNAVQDVGMALWNGVSWNPFATTYPFLSTIPGIGPIAQGWNAAWTETGRSLIGWEVAMAEDLVIGVGDAAENVMDWSADQADALWQMGKAGVGWAADTAEAVWHDSKDWVGDVWNNDNVQAIVDDWVNVGDAGVQFYAPFFDGGVPTITELVASSIQYNGAVIGAIGTTMAGGAYQLNIFDDGEPIPGVTADGKPIPGMTHNAGEDGHAEAVAPIGIPELLQSVTAAYDAGEASDGNEGYIRVTTIEAAMPGDPPRVIVSIPGTQPWSPLAGGVAADLTGNLVTAGGGRSTMAEAVKNAIADTNNVPADAEILLVGHSQGGMAAADLASDPEFLKDHKVTDVITFGSPVDSNRINPAINTLELQHTTDVVPRLDLEDASILDVALPGSGMVMDAVDEAVSWVTGNDPEANRAIVTMPNPSNPFNVLANHDHQEYRESVEKIIDPEADEWRDGKKLADYEESIDSRGFLTDEDSQISVRDIQVGRKG
jgi:hypothetical protein